MKSKACRIKRSVLIATRQLAVAVRAQNAKRSIISLVLPVLLKLGECCGKPVRPNGTYQIPNSDSRVLLDDPQPSTSTSSSEHVASTSRTNHDLPQQLTRQTSSRSSVESQELLARASAELAPQPPQQPASRQSAEHLPSPSRAVEPPLSTSRSTTTTTLPQPPSYDSVASANVNTVSAVASGISLQQLSLIIASQLEQNNQNIFNRIDALASQINVVAEFTERFATLENRVAAIEENQQPTENVNVDNLAQELQDRIFRSRNILVYGIPEDIQMPERDRIMQIFFAYSRY